MSFFSLVRLKGLEPTRLATREPKSRMSTNSITGAYFVNKPYSITFSYIPQVAFFVASGIAKHEKSGHLHISKKRGILHSVEL